MPKDAANEPGDDTASHARLKGDNIHDEAAVCPVAYPSFVTPECHRGHGRLFDESPALVQLHKSHVGMADGYDAE
jgi:hypothetical protein